MDRARFEGLRVIRREHESRNGAVEVCRTGDACLVLLEQLIAEETPPCLSVFTARTENLVFTDRGVCLQQLPDLTCWERGRTRRAAVNAAAKTIFEVLTRDLERKLTQALPEELLLMERRAGQADYIDWGQLQRDLALVPDTLPGIIRQSPRWARRIFQWLRRHWKALAGAVTLLLVVTALLSLVGAFCMRFTPAFHRRPLTLST